MTRLACIDHVVPPTRLAVTLLALAGVFAACVGTPAPAPAAAPVEAVAPGWLAWQVGFT